MLPLTASPASPHRSGFIAVVGRPNVGKSTLMNYYLGQKIAIVSDKPQTTRHTQLGILSREDAQVIFVDTPGIHEPRNELGKYMVETAARALVDADALLFIVDVAHPPDEGEAHIADLIRQKPGVTPVMLALNKMDLLKPQDVVDFTNAYRALLPEAQWRLISAKRTDNVDEMLEALIRLLPEGPPLYPEDEVTLTHLRDLAAEFVREAALNLLEQEVPHGLAIEISAYQERAGGLTYIAAEIYVERESHKRIVIGKGGQMLKAIGSAARAEIARMLDKKVYLELHVKVRKDWRKDAQEVQRLGYKTNK
jgi:GTP-binding protein Era